MKNDIIIFIIFISFCLLKECPKIKPIIKNNNENECLMITECTEEEYKEKICVLSNEIKKIQYLNNIINYNIEEYIEYFGAIVLSNKIIISFYYEDDEIEENKIFLYSLNDNEELDSKLIKGISYFIPYNNNILSFKMNNSDDDYLLICSNNYCSLINYSENSLKQVFCLCNGYTLSSINALFKLNDNFNYFYGFIKGTGAMNSARLIVNKFNLVSNKTKTIDNTIISQSLRMISCFETKNNIIECMIINNNKELYIILLEEANLDFIQKIYLDTVKSIYILKCIHLQKELGVYNYLTDENDKTPTLLLKNLIYNEDEGKYELIDIIDNSIIIDLKSDDDDITCDYLEIIKISEEKFSIIYILNFEKIVLILCHIYGKNENLNNLIVRHYEIPLILYNINYLSDPIGFLYENHISFTTLENSMNSMKNIPIIFIFGYNKNKEADRIVNINNIDNDNLYHIIKIKEYLNNNIIIENNIFGYEFTGVKIDTLTGISDGIKYYKNSNFNNNIIKDDILDINDEIYIDYSNAMPKPNSDFYIELTAIYGEPDYDKFNSFADSFESYGNESPKDYFKPQYFKSSSLKIEYNFGCHKNCEICEMVGLTLDNQKCTNCKINTNDLCFMKDEGNCFNTSSLIYKYYNSNGNFLCVEKNEVCPDDYPFENKNTKECKDTISYKDLDSDNYDINNSKKTIDTIIELLNEQIKNKAINYTIDTIIKGNNITFQIATPENQKDSIFNKLYYNISSIDLNECEEQLKNYYHINELIILKIDIKRNDTISTQVEYQVLNPQNGEVLNLSICENVTIDLYVPINFDTATHDLVKQLKEQGYDILNSKDSFYNDICTPYTSSNGTDVLIKDRKTDYYNPNLTLCEENCEYKSFDITTSKANCQCKAKTEIKSDTSETGFSPNILLKNFYVLETYTNYKVLKCYNLAFNKEIFKKNIGSYIMIFFILCFIIILIFNFYSQRKNYENLFKRIIYSNFLMDKKISKKNEKKNDKKNKEEYVNYNKNLTEPTENDRNLNNRYRLSTVDIDNIDNISILMSNNNNEIKNNEKKIKSRTENNKRNDLDEKSSIKSLFSDKTLFEEDQINSIKCIHSIKSPNKMNNMRKISNIETGSETFNDNKNINSKNNNNKNDLNNENEKNKISSQNKENNINNNSNTSIKSNILFDFDNFKYEKRKNDRKNKLSKISFDNKSSSRSIIDKKLIDNSINEIEKTSISSKIDNKNKQKLKHKVSRRKTLSYVNIKNDMKIDENERVAHILKNIPKKERANYFVDNELNDLEYKYAVNIDFRSFLEYYWSLLKQTHPVIFTFITKNDYNLFLLKVSLFLMSLALNLTMNALFFSDDSMHKLYVDNGKFDFVYNIPQTLYSSLLSGFFSFLFEKLSMSEENLLNFKEISIDDNDIFIKKEQEIKYLIIKSILYFSFGNLILLFFLYYLTCFCAVYYNTQIPLIKDTFISFAMGLLYPFPLTLIPALIRIPALRGKSTCLFRISRILTFIISLI